MSNLIVGTWKLISIIAILSDGSIQHDVYGANPIGFITYTSDGRMSVMFSRGDRALFSSDVNSPFDLSSVAIEELAQAFSSFSGYAGAYRIEGDRIIHRVEIASLPNRDGKDLIRTFKLDGNQIVLRTSPGLSDGVEKVFELRWERL